MALAFASGATGIGTNGTTVTGSLGTTVVGQLIVLTIADDSATTTAVTSVTDNKGNTYTKVPLTRTNNVMQNSVAVQMWYAKLTAAGAGHTVTVAWSTTNTGTLTVAAQYFNGFVGTPTFDQQHSGTGGSNTTANPGSVTTTVANEIVVIGAGNDGSSVGFSLGTGYTNLTSSPGSLASAGQESKVVSATGTQTGTMTLASSALWCAAMATFYDNNNVSGSATATETATITAAGSTNVSQSSTTTETATITAVGAAGVSQSASATETVTISATGGVSWSGSSTMSETVTITASGVAGFSQSASMALAAAITPGSVQMGSAVAVSLSGSIGISADGLVDRRSGATLALTGTLTSDGLKQLGSGVDLELGASITAAGAASEAAAVTSSLSVAITAVGYRGSGQGPTQWVRANGQWVKVVSQRLVIDVRDHGAVGDGITDDTTAIQNAINASAMGDTIFFAHGTYLVSSTIQLLKGRTYRGSGREKTTIRANNATNLDAVLASETWWSTTSTTSDNPINIYDLGVDGNGSNQTSGMGHGIALITFWNTLENLEVQNNTRGAGIHLSSSRRDGTEITNTAVECKVVRCDVRNNAYGIQVADPTASAQSVTDGFISDCIIAGTTESAISIDCAAGWSISGNHIYGAAKSGIYLNRGGYTRVIGNYIETWGSSATSGTYCGIMLGGDSASFLGTSGGVIIANNTLFYSGGAASASLIRGIRLDVSGGVTGHIVVSGNGVSGATQANGSHGIRISNQNSTATTFAYVAGNGVFGWDLNYDWAPNSGTFNVRGDVFQSGIPVGSTDGFGRLPTCAGAPTGTPSDTSAAGIPAIYDTTNNKLWIYNGAWKGVALA